jgi:hypothetical protein
MSWRTAFRTVASLFFVLAVTPLVGDFLVEYARQKGLYDDPEATVSGALTALAHIYQAWWYPWLTGFAAGLALGAWIDFLLRKASHSQSERSEKARQLGEDILSFLARTDAKYNLDRDKLSPRDAASFMGETISLLLRLTQLRIQIPNIGETPDSERLYRNYFAMVGPLVRDGNLSWASAIGAGFGAGVAALKAYEQEAVSVAGPSETQSHPSLEAGTPP